MLIPDIFSVVRQNKLILEIMPVRFLVKTSAGEDGAAPTKDFLGEVDAMMVNLTSPVDMMRHKNDYLTVGVRKDGPFAFECDRAIGILREFVEWFHEKNEDCARFYEKMPGKTKDFLKTVMFFCDCREITTKFHKRMEHFIHGFRVLARDAIEDYNHVALYELLRMASIFLYELKHNIIRLSVQGVKGRLRMEVKGAFNLREVLSNVKFDAFMKLGHTVNDVYEQGWTGLDDFVYLSDKLGARELCLLACLRKKNRGMFIDAGIPPLFRCQPGMASNATAQRAFFAKLLFMFATNDSGKLTEMQFPEREIVASFLLKYRGVDHEEYNVRMLLDYEGYMRMYLIDDEILSPTNAHRVVGAPADPRNPLKVNAHGHLGTSACGNCQDALGCGNIQCLRLVAAARPVGVQMPVFRLVCASFVCTDLDDYLLLFYL